MHIPFRKTLTYIALAIFVLNFCACAASLPDVKYIKAELATEQGVPEVEGAKGKLSPGQSEKILNKVEGQAPEKDRLDRQIKLMEEVSGTPLVAGNKVTLLMNGPNTYAAMLKAIGDAKETINLETFVFKDDEIGREFSDAFIKKRAEGVRVNIIYDSFGCILTPKKFFDNMRAAGINAMEFNPVNPVRAKFKWHLTRRDHRKILVVDGKVAFTGGVNISRVYESSPSSFIGSGGSRGWRDTHIMVEGPAVAEFQKLFMSSWKKAKGPKLTEEGYFPKLSKEGDDLVRVVGNTPGKYNRETYIMYLAAFMEAAQSIHLTNSYFVPDKQTLETLKDAARRGVDVKLILPLTSDRHFVLYAGRSHYEDLLEAGVKIFERKGGMLHAKTAVVDGVWSTVGSTNMDLWSFYRNDEVNAIILGADFGDKMEAMFDEDLADSVEITKEGWARRPWTDWLKERFSRVLSAWL
ncbi:MAG: cardiolipin synthase [Nitrospirota bacterium]